MAHGIKCQWCGRDFEARRRGHNVFCGTDCKRQKRLSVLRRDRAEAGKKVAGSNDKCIDCGKSFVLRHGHVKRCDPCHKVARAAAFAKYKAANRERILQRNREREAVLRRDLRWRLDNRMSLQIWQGLRGGKQGRSWSELVEFTIDDLMRHLERQFLPGMSWGNIGQWQVDHIVPQASFSYSSSDDAEFRACWALTNLRPLWSGDNARKRDRREFLI